MMFLWLPLLILVPLIMWWGVRPAGPGCCAATHAHVTPPAGAPDPIEIAKRRLASGEITPAQYDEIRRTLG